MDKRQFNVICEWSPFSEERDYSDVTSEQLTRAIELVSHRIETVGVLLGIASTSHDFSLEEHDLEGVGLMIKEMAQTTFYLADELQTRINRTEKEEDEEEEEDAEDPALLSEQCG